jgi:endonuclease-8
MPEGDTIHRLAAELGPVLVGEVLARVIVRGVARGPIGQRVARVAAIGKHLVITTDDGAEIRTHLGMNGRWHRVAAGAPIGTHPDHASLVLATARDTLVCRHAAAVEVTERRSAGRGLALAGLGPDLLDPELDLEAAVIDRVAGQPAARPIGEVLLDQRVIAGVGNIWRCEALHTAGIDPRTPIGEVDPDDVIAVYTIACSRMRQRVESGAMPALAVYDRAGAPCQRCSDRIATFRIADRWAYACPSCQPRLPRGK